MADQNIVELVKQRNPIEDVIEADGYPLDQKRGTYRKCTLPHDGGLVVNVQQQLFYWNQPDQHGDVIAWVQLHRKCDFKAAVEWLCDRASIERPNWHKQDPAERLAARMREDALDVAMKVFRKWLRQSEDAQAYCKRRGWTLEAEQGEDVRGLPKLGTVIAAGLGYSGVGSPEEYAEMRAALSAAGVDLSSPVAVSIIGFKGDTAKWMNDHQVSNLSAEWIVKGYIPGMVGQKRLVYPHVRYGRVTYLAGRSIDKKFHFNLPEPLIGKKQPFWNHEYGNNAKKVLIVEGQADAVSLGQLRMDAVALAGSSASDGLSDALKGHEVLYVGLDADETGRKKAWTVADALGPLARIVNWRWTRFAAQMREGRKTVAVATADDLVKAVVDGQLVGAEKPEILTSLLATLPVVKNEHGFDCPAWTNWDGQRTAVRSITEVWHAVAQVLRNPAEAAEARAKLLRELLDWAPVFVTQDDQGRELLADAKDANDLLRAMIGAGMTGDEQHAHVAELLKHADTYVEEICRWAGQQEGADRDEARTKALRVVARLEELDFTNYRKDLGKLLGVTVREMQAMLKALQNKEEKEKTEGEPVYIWGGCIDGYLIEYVYDIEHDHAFFAWRDPQGRVDSGNELVIAGKRFLPYPQNETLKSGAISFASALGERKPIRELVAYIELYLRSIYIMPSDQTAKLVAYWVLLTWLYDAFETVIYLRAMGGAGAGKSEFVKRVGLICYRTMTANGAGSTSSLFRAVERYKSTVLLDEADLAQSDTEQDMIKFYNLGAMRGNPIWRTVEVTGPNGQKDWEEKSFQTFCPKLIAMRKDFRDDAVGSRSLTLKLVPREMMELKEAGIPLSINASIRARAQAIRNLLLRWRLETWQPEIEVDPEFYDLTISPRLNQVAGPLLAIARDDPDQQEDIRRVLRDYYAESIIGQSMTIAARVLEALWKIYKYPDLSAKMVKREDDGSEIIRIADVTKITNELINAMNADSDGTEDDEKKKTRELTPHKIGRMIREELALQVPPRKSDGYYVKWNEARIKGLSIRYGVNPDDLGPQDSAKAAPKPVQSNLI